MLKINKATLDFLSAVKENNNRDWFLQNKAFYQEAKENFEQVVQQLIKNLLEFEPILKGLEAKTCIYRINRDIRFSNDKSPYKTHFGAFIVRGGRKNGDRFAGYYFHIEPGGSIAAGGSYMPPSPWLAAIRERIDEEPGKLRRIIEAKEFVNYFGALDGEKLKTAPKGFTVDHPDIDLLRFKSYLVVNQLDEQLVTSDRLISHVTDVFRAMKPLNDFLNMDR
ncbi:MAG TPA: DUF2461 domain-containing protein [Bacteroidales bacterium]|nr:DUF2461 domain-containing protein [Bacteroidales bacterium]